MDLTGLVGRRLDLADDEYRFGSGEIRVQVCAVLGVTQTGDGPWPYLRVERIRTDGRREQRQILVKPSAVRRAINQTAGRDQEPSQVTVESEGSRCDGSAGL